jgi:predicted sulfurtransferase
MIKRFIFTTCLVAFLLLTATTAGAEERPLWWEQAEAEAKREGYLLITLEDLKTLYDSGKPLLVLDVRPDYEYERGHLPHAVNLEFHLGERLILDPVKRKHFQELLGPNKDRTIVIYCRNFR